MSQYFFDLRSGVTFSQDKDGIELPHVEAAHDMALSALVDASLNAVTEGSMDQRFAVEVRNGVGPVLEITAVFRSKIFRHQ